MFFNFLDAQNLEIWTTTSTGGTYNDGALISFEPSSGVLTTHVNFHDNNTVGAYPASNLTMGSNGKTYGVARAGGTYNEGVIFSYEMATGAFTIVASFNGTNGSYPFKGMVEAPNGKFYGTTVNGGTNSIGVLFEFDPVTNIITKKYDFSMLSGYNSRSALVLVNSSEIYGTTSNGGANDDGVIFCYNFLTDTFTTKHEFDYTDGAIPQGSLLKVGNSKIYGTCSSGGGNLGGVIYMYDTAYDTFSNVHDFVASSGYHSRAGLAIGGNNMLYGMTENGGTNNYGVLYAFNTVNNSYSVEYNFDGYYNGGWPYGVPTLDGTGKLYGTTTYGGASNAGTIFEFDTSTGVLTKLYDLTVQEGSHPRSKVLLINSTPMNVANFDAPDITFYPNPASDKIHITSEDPLIALRIYDVQGKLLVEQTSIINNTISTASLATGLYLVSCKTTTKEVIKKIQIE
ncbi:hypothetical protein Y10_06690 [Neptunitalea sp. Y10]|uniref:Secretion system C-terminal sorting domain-containing protein n=1 Tax=Neptunitalea lumnitzerae TaxID=2965509 RepID=A0ABQ5MFV4_9FLAO|nr:hypothetical protein Y10_06690 [Neptunitalea sp. Y10]